MSDLTKSILTGMDASITPGKYLLCALAALVCGVAITVSHSFKNKSNMSLYGTIAFLPVVVMTIVLVVSHNIGAGISVAGTFALIRFRSVQGDARSIGNIFCATAAGMLCGLGFIFYAIMFSAIVFIFEAVVFFALKNVFVSAARYLKITIPENLDYENVFDDVFKEYLKSYEILRVRTTDMGSLFEITYLVAPKTAELPKEFIDKLRTKNGNLGIVLSRDLPESVL